MDANFSVMVERAPSAPQSHNIRTVKSSDQRERERAHDARRRTHRPWRRWYKLAAWQRLRAAQLSRQPLCERHLAIGDVVPATVVNHRAPHRGDWSKFEDPANHESLCEACHNALAQADDVRGYALTVGPDGWPTDARHPANRSAPATGGGSNRWEPAPPDRFAR